MQSFLRNLELWLTAAGLVVVAIAAAWSAAVHIEPWRTAAIAATAVGVIHGVLFWLVRSRQRKVREQAIAEVQFMLSDIVNNQLGIIMAAADMSSSSVTSTETAERASRIRDSVQRISDGVRHLSEESLGAWSAKYARTLQSLERYNASQRG
ncbi:MAG TPA: hypothetical protein VGE76_08090 [Opitutaceae bacterium]